MHADYLSVRKKYKFLRPLVLYDGPFHRAQQDKCIVRNDKRMSRGFSARLPLLFPFDYASRCEYTRMSNDLQGWQDFDRPGCTKNIIPKGCHKFGIWLPTTSCDLTVPTFQRPRRMLIITKNPLTTRSAFIRFPLRVVT